MDKNFNPNPIPASAYEDGTYVNYKLGVYVPYILVFYNGKWEPLPQTAPGSSYIVSSFVSDARNVQGTFVGQQIGRNQVKFNNLVFPFLYAHEWTRVLKMLKMNQPTFFKFFDVEAGREIQRTLYPSDRTATPYAYAQTILKGESTYRPEIYSNCSVNLIDRGEQ